MRRTGSKPSPAPEERSIPLRRPQSDKVARVADVDESHRNPATIEYVNIGLMLVALAAAAALPFEVFLLSYAVLGPLHYLTEISWLHDRRFFAPRRSDWLPLVCCTLFITLGKHAVFGPN